jgi:hypothetical protein
VKKANACPLDDDFSKPPSEPEWAKETAKWDELVRQNRHRLDSSFFIGPRQPKSLKDIHVVKPLPPRERGRARMERELRHAFSVVSKGKSYRFIRSNMIMGMCYCFDDIAAIIDETVVDDDKAGLLMQTIGYALGRMATFARGESESGRERLLARYQAIPKLNGVKRGEQLAEVADIRWRLEGEKIWRDRYADLAPDDPNRITVEDLAVLIQDDVAGDIKFGTIEKQIGKWNKRDGIKPNAKRRR